MPDRSDVQFVGIHSGALRDCRLQPAPLAIVQNVWRNLPLSMSVAENIGIIQERVARAARRAGRDPHSVSLMAVTKTISAHRIREAYDSGIRLFGESRVQEFAVKPADLRGLQDSEWHMIGHLQTNKSAKALELFTAVDSVDSLRLAQKLNAEAAKLSKCLKILIEINVGGEVAKSGITAGSSQLEELLQAAPSLDCLQFRGLMTVPPFSEDVELARPYFRQLRELRDQIAARHLPVIRVDILSMGMSHDFEIAIEEGSTCVRIGTAIFGDRS